MSKKIVIPILLLAVSVGVYFMYPVDRFDMQPGLSGEQCLFPKDGVTAFYKFNPERIFAFGLTYGTHIKETSENNLSAMPPLFRKEIKSLVVTPDFISLPDHRQLLEMAEETEPGLAAKIKEECEQVDPLIDYEVELGFVLLEEVDWDNIKKGSGMPKIGYFLSNDVTSRFIQVLGEGQTNRYDYWTASKSFSKFLPIGNVVWIPKSQQNNSILCIELKCIVNGEVRQKETTSNIMYSPAQMLNFIYRKYPKNLPKKGDIILTGTPGGVAFQVPAWKKKLADFVNLGRFTKVNLAVKSAGKDNRFLKKGDTVTFSGGILGTITIKVK